MRDANLEDLSLDWACAKAGAGFGMTAIAEGAFPVVLVG